MPQLTPGTLTHEQETPYSHSASLRSETGIPRSLGTVAIPQAREDRLPEGRSVSCPLATLRQTLVVSPISGVGV